MIELCATIGYLGCYALKHRRLDYICLASSYPTWRLKTQAYPLFHNPSKSSIKVYTTGITKRLSNVDVTKPPITAIAIGLRKLVSAPPKPITIGTMPAIMAMVVMTMGRARL